MITTPNFDIDQWCWSRWCFFFQEDNKKEKRKRIVFPMFLSFSPEWTGRALYVSTSFDCCPSISSGGQTGSSKAVNTCHRKTCANTLQIWGMVKWVLLRWSREHFSRHSPLVHVLGMGDWIERRFSRWGLRYLIPDAGCPGDLRIIRIIKYQFFLACLGCLCHQSKSGRSSGRNINWIRSKRALGSAPLHQLLAVKISADIRVQGENLKCTLWSNSIDILRSTSDLIDGIKHRRHPEKTDIFVLIIRKSPDIPA